MRRQETGNMSASGRPEQRGTREQETGSEQDRQPVLSPFTFLLSTLLAVLALGWAWTYMAARESPVGKIEGSVLLADLRRPLGGVEITLQPTDYTGRERRLRHAVTNASGQFTLLNVPEGDYDITAASRAHQAQDVKVSVMEGKTTLLSLSLTRTSPELEIKQHQRVFGTTERAHLALSGYVDSERVLAVPPRPDTLHLRVFRTRLSDILNDGAAASALDEVGRETDATPNLPTALLHPKHGHAPRLLLDRDVTINTADKEGFFYQKLDLRKLGAAMPTGLYLVDVKHAKQTVCSWLLVTDTALIVKRAKSQLVAFAVDMRTGTPVGNSVIRTYRNGQVVASGRTDARGVTQYQVEGIQDSEQSDSTRVTTIALRGDDEAVVQRNAYSEENQGAYVVYAYTDRPVYRPGQRIYFKGIVRRRKEEGAQSAADGSGVAPDAPLPPDVTDAAAESVGSRYEVPRGEAVDVEIRDKSGERILEQRLVTNRWGAFSGQVDLLREAATGVYTLVTRIGEKEHTSDIYVASYKKPEYAVTVTPDKKFYVRGEHARVIIEGKFYFGAPVAGAKVHYSLYSSPSWASEYADDDPGDGDDSAANASPMFARYRADSYYGATMRDGNVTLDAEGRAVVEFDTTPVKKPGANAKDAAGDTMQTPDTDGLNDGAQEEVVTVSATVTEGADREVEATGEARITQGAFRLSVTPQGYVAKPGQPVGVVLMARDFAGNPVANLPVTLQTGYESWKKTYQYVKDGVQSGVTGADGRVTLAVTASRQGDLVLSASASDADGHRVHLRESLWVTGDSGGDLDTTYDDLALLADKRSYNPGDTARVLLNAANVGQTVLLTVEGERVHHIETVPIRTRSTVVKIPVLAAYGPNVFLSACYVQNKHFAQSETSLRVLMPQSELRVTVTEEKEESKKEKGADTASGQATSNKQQAASNPPSRYMPGERVTYAIQVTDAHSRGQACELSFGVVDEAIYALREDDPKALRQAFYPRRYNAVNTQYSFAVEYLGDADKTEPKIETRKKFPDTAYWNPNVVTDANGRANVSFLLPDNLTTWRATAAAYTDDTRVGRGTNKILVSRDFFVRVQTPRALTQRDVSQVVAIVHNETGQPQTALVRLTAPALTMNGDQTQTLHIAPGASAQAVWPVTANEYGEARLKVTAWTPKTEGGTQYTDGMETMLPVRPHGREDEMAWSGELTSANAVQATLTLDPNAVPGLSHVTLRLTPSIAASLTGGVNYLIGYPYGCVEQTLSRILPDMQVRHALQSRGLTLDAATTRKSGEIGLMVREGLARLGRFQHPSGAWGWWEHDSDDPWMTAYVLVGLATARTEGYTVGDNMLNNGRKAGLKLLAKCKPREKPFLVYGLAMAGERDTLKQARRTLSLPGMNAENLAYAALTDDLLGQDSGEARRLLDSRAIQRDNMLHWSSRVSRDKTTDGETGMDSDDQDDLTATAMALRVLLRHDAHDARIAPVLRWLMYRRTGDYWGSTRDTAWTLAALSDYLAAQPDYAGGGQIQVAVNGRAFQTVMLNGDNLREKEIVVRVPPSALRPGKNTLALSRTGGNSAIFYAVQLRQTVGGDSLPPTAANVMEGAGNANDINGANNVRSVNNIGNGIKIVREYLRVSSRQAGDTPWKVRAEPTHNVLLTGDHVRVRLTLRVPRDMAYVLIEDPFPMGCEVSERDDASEVTDWNYWWSSVDVRDDRIAFFARTLSKGEHVIEYNLRAQTPGTYSALPTLLQAMYAPEAKGYAPEANIEIKQGENK